MEDWVLVIPNELGCVVGGGAQNINKKGELASKIAQVCEVEKRSVMRDFEPNTKDVPGSTMMRNDGYSPFGGTNRGTNRSSYRGANRSSYRGDVWPYVPTRGYARMRILPRWDVTNCWDVWPDVPTRTRIRLVFGRSPVNTEGNSRWEATCLRKDYVASDTTINDRPSPAKIALLRVLPYNLSRRQ